MRIMAAMHRMDEVLSDKSVDAPARQLRGVRDWRADIAEAVAAGSQLSGAGMHIDDHVRLIVGGVLSRPPKVRFLYGDPTHRAWRKLCKAIVDALHQQQAHAQQIIETAHAQVAVANRKDATAAEIQRGLAAAARAKAAETWWMAAGIAVANGQVLIRREDAISRPVGYAIAAAGGLGEVVRDKHYHQAGRL